MRKRLLSASQRPAHCGAHAVDSADRAGTDALIADLTERHGGVAVVVANACAELVDLIPHHLR